MQPPIDVLLIGHICRDETPEGARLGGTVIFSALTVRALGLRAGILTSAPDDMLPFLEPLADIPIQRMPAPQATTFTNVYTSEGRQQVISGRALPLAWRDIPREWRSPPLVHLAPVAGEIELELIARFPSAFVGVTPQGWLRQWDKRGRVSFRRGRIPNTLLHRLSAMVISAEDVQGDEALLQKWARQCRVMVATRGDEGCTLFVDGRPEAIPAAPVGEIDPTGAGDVFAAAFFSHLQATLDPGQAARVATYLAGRSVTRPGLDGIPTRQEVEEARRIS